jgi:hypothetical protein
MSAHRRDSDRWITPRVVAWALFCGTVLVLAVVGAVTYLTARGLDPDPMLSLVGNLGTAVAAIGTLLLQLTGRATTTKVERNTGLLAAKVDETAAKVDAALWVDEQRTEVHQPGLPPVPPLVRTEPHPFAGPRT